MYGRRSSHEKNKQDKSQRETAEKLAQQQMGD